VTTPKHSHPGTNQTWRTYETSASYLAVTAIYPLSSLSFMLMRWQRGDLEGITLEVPSEEEGFDADGEPIVRYESEEEYESYVLQLCNLLKGHCNLFARRIQKIETYYLSLGVDVLFKRHPKLEQYLRETFDDKLVARVCFPHNPRSQNSDTSTAPDFKCRKKPACGAYHARTTGDIAVSPPIKHTATGWHSHPSQLAQGRPGTEEQRHRPILDTSPAPGSV
jgi:hypothetical protein